MSTEVLAAVISALVSLVVSGATFLGTRRQEKAERLRLERELEREFTTRLYDLRIRHYPRGFAITQRLSGEEVTGDLSPGKVTALRSELVQWVSEVANFTMSRKAVAAYYALRDALAQVPEDGATYSHTQRERMWQAKNLFRGALRGDLALLYAEDRPFERRRQLILRGRSHEPPFEPPSMRMLYPNSGEGSSEPLPPPTRASAAEQMPRE